MNKEVIEKMKDNERAFMFLISDEREVLKEAKMVGKLRRLGIFNNIFSTLCWERVGPTFSFYSHYVYRIDGDYNPEPEIIRCKVFLSMNGWVFYDPRGSNHFISVAPSIKDFHRFEYADGSLLMKPVKTSRGKNEWCVAVLFKGEL